MAIKRKCACFVKKTAKPGRPKASALCKKCGRSAESHGKKKKRRGIKRKAKAKRRVGKKKAKRRGVAKRRTNPLVLDPGGISYTGPYGPFGYLNRTRYPNSGRVNNPPIRPVGPVQRPLSHDDRFNSFRAMLNQFDGSPAWGPGLGNPLAFAGNPSRRKKRRKGKKARRVVSKAKRGKRRGRGKRK